MTVKLKSGFAIMVLDDLRGWISGIQNPWALNLFVNWQKTSSGEHWNGKLAKERLF
jgi:hypothetical protein